MADVFISYAHADRERVARLVGAIEALGVDCWGDQRIEPGAAFSDEIQRELHACAAHVVCWSSAAVASQWVLGEAEIGRQRGLLAPVRFEDCAIPPPFNMIHAEDLSDFDPATPHDGFRKLLATIGARLGRRGLVDLFKIPADAPARDWKAWAEAHPHDPFASEAWARYEALHLDAEKNRIAEERAVARVAASEQAARQAEREARAAAEQERLARLRAEAETEALEARRNAAVTSLHDAHPTHGWLRGTLYAAGVAAVLSIAVLSYRLFGDHRPLRFPEAREPAAFVSVTPAAAAAMYMQGSWRRLADTACREPLVLAFESNASGEWLILRARLDANFAGAAMSADGERRERIVGLDGQAVRTRPDGDASNAEARYLLTDSGLDIATPAGASETWAPCDE